MKILIIISFVMLVFACNKPADQPKMSEAHAIVSNDTVVYSWEITDELAGGAYRKRAKGYRLIIGNDTSDLKTYFGQDKQNGSVSIILRFLDKRSYREQWNELVPVLKFAMKDFAVNPDSLQSVSLGRLIECGDAAIDVTRLYAEEGSITGSVDSNELYQAILKSKLAKDWNIILNPYGVAVTGASAEKMFFVDRADLPNYSKIESDSSMIPARIADCMLWLRFGK